MVGPELVAYPLAAAVLAVASFTDMRTREVPDWVSYGSIVAGIGLASVSSVVLWSFWPLAYSVAGLVVFLAVSSAMFYSGQWGGGDSKLLIGLGSILGLRFGFSYPFVALDQPVVWFCVNLLFVGAVYAVLWSVALAFANRARFAKQFVNTAASVGQAGWLFGLFGVLAFSAVFFLVEPEFRFVLLGAFAALLSAGLLWLFSKSVEKSCMLKRVDPVRLTEGDWIARDVYCDGKYVCGPKDLGIEKHQIALLLRLKAKGKVNSVLVKEGIPFVPAFLISFLVSLKYGNVLLLLLR
ncbi:prepilin peptidase [Candidatus Woesearchaeota archaeon]|nr:prepilin peptidase [Candidatus Woesearchaeota archaeon]